MIIVCWGYIHPTPMLIVKTPMFGHLPTGFLICAQHLLVHLGHGEKMKEIEFCNIDPTCIFEVIMSAYGTIEDKQP